MNETLFSIVPSDISDIKSRSAVLRLFKKLAYNVEDDLRMPFGDLELPGRLKDFVRNDGKAIYLVSNYDRMFQIYLFETNNLHLTPIKSICQSFAKKQGDYLLLFTTEYTEIVFVNPLSRPGGVELRRLKLDTRREAFHTELQVLNALALPQADMNPFDIYDLQCEAFRKERVTNDFYKTYKNVFEDVRESLGKVQSDAQAHAFTQILMNRLMLLYFVQKRGWLNNSTDFLREFHNECRQDERKNKSFYRDYLEPLFFRAFNRENGFEDLDAPDTVKEIFKNAPYLNGGMFVHLEEIEPPDINVPDTAFDLMFDRLFDRYNFTVREDTPLDIELAVDPELLGNVYQRLVSEQERGQAGLFYTQATEVNFMCQRALIEYLARHLPEKRKAIIRLIMNYLDPPDDIDMPWESLEEYLVGVKICDPACGSGAFLVAMLHLLVDLRTFVRKRFNQDTDTFELKKAIISQNLYGADVKAHAVRIAELRLWLSLVVDAPDDFVQKHPDDPLLPNLTYRLRQGDSLIEEFAGVPLHLRGEFSTTGKRIPQIMQKLYDLEYKIFHGRVKSGDLAKTKAQHQKLEQELFQGILKDRMESVRAQIKPLKRKIEKPPEIQQGLFGTEAEQTQLDFEKTFRKKTEKEIAALEDTLEEYRRLLESEDFGKLSERDYVLWEIDFAEVFMSKGGFDIIIGNPPYVRQEEIGPPTIVDRPTTREERKAYKEKLIRSAQAYVGKQFRINKKSDLYVYFYYLGMSLLNKDGVFVFITSNSWLDVGYGADLQEWLLNNMEMMDIYDNQAKRAFKSADINTVIVVFNKPSGNPLTHTARFTAFKKPLEDVVSSDTFIAIEAAKGIVSTDDFRVYQIAQQELLEEGFEKDKTQKELKKTIPLAGKYKGNKWGGKYLRAPDIYFKILEKAGDKLVRLGDIAEVRFGIKTGCNEFFYFNDEKIKEWGIEDEFLVPVIKSPRESRTIIIDPDVLPNKLFMCHNTKKEIKDTNALEYIKWGESQGFHKRPSTRSRPRWWDLGERGFGHFLWFKAFNDRFLVVENRAGLPSSDRFYTISLKKNYLGIIDQVAVALNSSLSHLLTELNGRVNLGEGALDNMTYEAEQILIANPSFLHGLELGSIAKRTILKYSAEIESEDRIKFDKEVFDRMDLPVGFLAEVYSGIELLVNNRLNRASSC
ncbi:MAG: Eco57I restriction-modification methylase domain-containing protein [Thermodesulfobacteriota bacterium]|nr:Eco57I restriction-modification methylase domain-containing protein [Thermodesulfobacteriota bacterium]